jgi:hypothetical protein
MPRKKNISPNPEREKIMGILKNTTPEDFDGHTEFSSMTPEQRLQWLSDGARFLWEARTRNERLKKNQTP